MSNLLSSIVQAIADFYETGSHINSVIETVLAFCVIHKAFYFIIGFFFTRKFKPAKNKHKYAIMIAARNEKYVIGHESAAMPYW